MDLEADLITEKSVIADDKKGEVFSNKISNSFLISRFLVSCLIEDEDSSKKQEREVKDLVNKIQKSNNKQSLYAGFKFLFWSFSVQLLFFAAYKYFNLDWTKYFIFLFLLILIPWNMVSFGAAFDRSLWRILNEDRIYLFNEAKNDNVLFLFLNYLGISFNEKVITQHNKIDYILASLNEYVETVGICDKSSVSDKLNKVLDLWIECKIHNGIIDGALEDNEKSKASVMLDFEKAFLELVKLFIRSFKYDLMSAKCNEKGVIFELYQELSSEKGKEKEDLNKRKEKYRQQLLNNVLTSNDKNEMNEELLTRLASK